MVMRQPLIEYGVVIDTDGTAIDVEELTDFLYHFRAAYSAAINNGALNPDGDPEAIAEIIRQEALGKNWEEMTHLAHQDLGTNKLGIVDIHRKNPLTIVFEGILIAVTVAVILSGGRMKVGPLEVRLPPLGDGIRSLRDSFGRKPKPRKRKP